MLFRLHKVSGLLLFSFFLAGSKANLQKSRSVDICIYGGTSSGVIAAYTAKKMGKTVLLIEPGTRLGGLSSGGLGYTDIGNKYAISGLALDFYRRIGKHYGKFEQWIFEPHVAEELFREYIQTAGVETIFSYRLKSVQKEKNSIRDILVENADQNVQHPDIRITAKMFLDCSYEGDLMAGAGVSFIIGRESENTYHESYNGVRLRDKHQFPDGVDPYIEKGKPESGLLWGISPETLSPDGTGDKKVQTYNFRICLTNDNANRVPVTQPDGYDPSRYELLIRLLEKEPGRPFELLMKPDYMPNHKTDINNNGPFSTDMIGMNYGYPGGSYSERKKIQQEHERYTKGLLYFIGHDPRIPEAVRTEMLKWGYPRDEYTDNGNWSPQLYIREARRMIGDYVMTQANCEGKEKVSDGVGMAAYTMDSHNCQRIVIEKDGKKIVKNEGDVQVGGFPPYPVSFRSLIPKEQECSNLLVPVCLSASHIAYGSIRMEPVFMVMGQSAAAAATMAIDNRSSIQRIDVKALQAMLQTNPLADYRQPDLLIDNEQIGKIKVQGNWKKNENAHNSYASSSLQCEGLGKGDQSVKFSTMIPSQGQYKIYSYTPEQEGSTSAITFRISDGKKTQDASVNLRSLRVEGQTSGEWVYIGTYFFRRYAMASVEVTDKNADGIIIADAVLFVQQ